MADLTKYVNPALKEGDNFDVYLNHFPQIGKGNVATLQPLNAKLIVQVLVFGQSLNGEVEITMPDTAPQGFCTVDLNGNIRPHCPYQAGRTALTVQVDDRTLSLYPGDTTWSWLDVSGVPGSVGIQPTSMALHDQAETPAAADA